MIVYGVLSLDVGGLERIVVSLAKYVAERGEPVTVVCVERPGALANELESVGVKVVSLNKPPGRDASGSCTIKANDLVSAGASFHDSSGEASSPSEV